MLSEFTRVLTIACATPGRNPSLYRREGFWKYFGRGVVEKPAMPKVLEQDNIEVWLYIYDEAMLADCFCNDDEVVIDLETLQILSFTDDLSSGRLIRKSGQIVSEPGSGYATNGMN